jgi:hypothetical protein
MPAAVRPGEGGPASASRNAESEPDGGEQVDRKEAAKAAKKAKAQKAKQGEEVLRGGGWKDPWSALLLGRSKRVAPR